MNNYVVPQPEYPPQGCTCNQAWCISDPSLIPPCPVHGIKKDYKYCPHCGEKL